MRQNLPPGGSRIFVHGVEKYNKRVARKNLAKQDHHTYRNNRRFMQKNLF